MLLCSVAYKQCRRRAIMSFCENIMTSSTKLEARNIAMPSEEEQAMATGNMHK